MNCFYEFPTSKHSNLWSIDLPIFQFSVEIHAYDMRGNDNNINKFVSMWRATSTTLGLLAVAAAFGQPTVGLSSAQLWQQQQRQRQLQEQNQRQQQQKEEGHMHILPWQCNQVTEWPEMQTPMYTHSYTHTQTYTLTQIESTSPVIKWESRKLLVLGQGFSPLPLGQLGKRVKVFFSLIT